MKDKRTLHLRVQELCDCFADTDPLREMAAVSKEEDREEGAVKWLALAVLHGIDRAAKKITITRDKDGGISVTAKYRKWELPSPGGDVGRRIFDVVQEITHIEKKKGKTPLAIGIRDSSIEITVGMEKDGEAGSVTLEFPE